MAPTRSSRCRLSRQRAAWRCIRWSPAPATSSSVRPAKTRSCGRLFPAPARNETQVPLPAPQLQVPAAEQASPAGPGGRVAGPWRPANPHKFGSSETPATGERNRYVIISDMKSGSITGLEEEIFNLGPAHRFMPQAWILTSDVSLSAIRAGLIQKLGKLDTLFIVDAAHDKAAWFNFGPEADIKVRRMWTRTSEAPQGFKDQRSNVRSRCTR